MFDVFFVTYEESNAIENFMRVCQFAPQVIQPHRVQGIHNAHLECARASSTDHFFVVDGDNWIEDGFSFELDFTPDPDTIYVWRCRNPVNGLIYGWGAIKLFPKAYVTNMLMNTVDMSTAITMNYQIVNVVASETRFNSSPYDAWRSGFREAVKLASAIIPRQVQEETDRRLRIWCSRGMTEPNGSWAIDGAREGRDYGTLNAGNLDELIKINDFHWVRSRYVDFCRRYG